MSDYLKLIKQHSGDLYKLNKKYNLVSFLRLITIIILIFLVYKSIQTNDIIFVLFGLFVFICFILLLKIHEKISWNKKIKKHLISINKDEIIYLNKEEIPFEDGVEYIDVKHFYSFDLDLFGKNSLYQNLNRTATYIGSEKLSQLLLKL